jgi:hypothetical protein
MRLHIVAREAHLDFWVDMGDGPATLTGGLGGWQTVERIDDVALTDWVGQGPLTQDIPVMLDGYPDESVERDLKNILALGRDTEGPPPVFEIDGPIYFPEAHWVLPDGGIALDPGSTIRSDNGTILRQALTLSVLEYVPPDEVRLRGKKRHKDRFGVADNRALTVVTKPGDNLAKIAAREFGDWRKWTLIGPKNSIADPHRILPAGRVIRL